MVLGRNLARGTRDGFAAMNQAPEARGEDAS
jgi:hypothetical protein